MGNGDTHAKLHMPNAKPHMPNAKCQVSIGYWLLAQRNGWVEVYGAPARGKPGLQIIEYVDLVLEVETLIKD